MKSFQDEGSAPLPQSSGGPEVAVEILGQPATGGAGVAWPDKLNGPNVIKIERDEQDQVPLAFQVADVHNLAGVAPGSWPHIGPKGLPLNTIPNLRHLLENYRFTVRNDVIRNDVVVTHPGQSGAPESQRSKVVDTVSSLCALNGLAKADVQSFLVSIGDDNRFNPVQEFIMAHPWDRTERFGDLTATVTTKPGFDRSLFELLLRRWLISAVAAAVPAKGRFRSKGVLVFQGEQSIGKTAWIRSLLPPHLRDLVKIDAHIDPANKDTIISAVSHWLVELGELDGTLRKADIARLKGFISQDVDQFRRPYGRAEEKIPRHTVFFASVNPEQFLADDTGNGRWWTVPVERINYEHGIDMQQLWAEVFHWYLEGERWWLDRDEERRLEKSNLAYQRSDPIDELIASRYDFAAPRDRHRFFTATEVLVELGYERPTRSQLNEAGAAMRARFGDWTKSNGRKVFSVPPFITAKRKGTLPDEDHPF